MRFPSSFEAEFRPMRGAELSALANAPDSSIIDAIIGVLRSTWIKTIDPGPYTHADGDATPQFDKMLSGDLVYSLIALAVENVPDGNIYRFPVQCPRRHRDRQYEVTVDLKMQLLAEPAKSAEGDEPPPRIALKRLSQATVAHLRERGNRFEEMCAGKRIVYKLQSNSDAKVTRDLLKLYPAVKTFTPTEQLAVQCLEIEGLKSNSIRERYQFFEGVSSAELYALYARVVAQDCGIDTEIKAQCPVCEWEQDVDLPFGGLFLSRKS